MLSSLFCLVNSINFQTMYLMRLIRLLMRYDRIEYEKVESSFPVVNSYLRLANC